MLLPQICAAEAEFQISTLAGQIAADARRCMPLHATTWIMQIPRLPCCNAIIRAQFCARYATYIVYLNMSKDIA